MRFFAFNQGITKPFRIKLANGDDKDISGLTIVWYFVDRSGNTPSGISITGTITDGEAGQVDMVIPENFFLAIGQYNSQLNLADGVAYDEDTDPFVVNVENPRLRTE